jgi:hypothetical protein
LVSIVASSGRALLVAAALVAAVAGCGGENGPGGAGQGDRETGASPRRAQAGAATAPAVKRAAEGPAIEPGPGAVTLEAEMRGRLWTPLAAYGRDIIVRSVALGPQAAGGEADEYFLWRPGPGELTPLWQGEAGTQDMVTSAEPPWVATVRTERSLPFAEWALILRNIETGEEQVLARSDERLRDVPGLQPRLPAGFAPQPQLSGARVAWAAIAFDEEGAPRERVHLYDLSTGEDRVVFEVADPAATGVWSVSIGGSRVAWIHLPAASSPLEIAVMDLETGGIGTMRDVGAPFSAALSADGRYLAWDDSMKAKYALDLDTGERVQYAGDVGWGTFVSGGRVAWAPATNRGGKGGFYDFAAGEVRYREDTPGAIMNIALVLGPWFAWQERPFAGSGGVYHFVPLDGLNGRAAAQ